MTDLSEKIGSSIEHPRTGELLTEEEADQLGLVTSPEAANDLFASALNDRDTPLDSKQRRGIFKTLGVAFTPATVHAFEDQEINAGLKEDHNGWL